MSRIAELSSRWFSSLVVLVPPNRKPGQCIWRKNIDDVYTRKIPFVRIWDSIGRRKKRMIGWKDKLASRRNQGSMLYSHLQRHNDKDAGRKTHNKDAGRTSFQKYSPLTLLQGFERLACERMLETEYKLHILTPLLWPSRCVFLVLLDAQPEVLGSTPSGLFRGPPRSGVAFPTTSGL